LITNFFELFVNLDFFSEDLFCELNYSFIGETDFFVPARESTPILD